MTSRKLGWISRAKGAFGSRCLRLLMGLIIVAVALAGTHGPIRVAASGGITFDGAPGTSAPPSLLGPYTITQFGPDSTPIGALVSQVADPAGTIGFSTQLEHLAVGDGWATWSNGYTGSVYYDSGTSLTISLPAGTEAFYFYGEPNPFAIETIQATAQDGTTSGPIDVNGYAGASYFGFYATGSSSLASISISASSDFAVGEFGIYQNVDPSISSPPTPSLQNAVLTSTSATGSATVTVNWSGTQGSSPICSYTLEKSVGQGAWTAITLSSPTATSATDTLAYKTITQYRVQATGCNGLMSQWVSGAAYGYLLRQENNTVITYSPTTAWARTKVCDNCSGGYEETTSTANASFTVGLNAAYSAALVLSTGPMNGQATVYVDSVAVGSVDTYAPTKGFLQALFSVAWGSAYGTHTVKVVNAATSGHPQLQLDAVMSLFGATPAASSAVSAVAGNTSAAVSWTAVKGGTTPVLTYVAAAIDQTNPANGGQTCSTAPPTTSCTINGLVDGDSYVFTVTAQNVYGDGNPSASSVAVIPGTPGIPTNVKAKPLASSASVSWTAPNPGGAAISGYTVFWTNTTTRKSGSQACPGSATTCLIKPLVKGDKYTFSVAATNTYGTGPASPATAAVKIT